MLAGMFAPRAAAGPPPGGSTFDPSLKGTNVTLSNGNLDASTSGSNFQSVYATTGRNSGRYAFEIQVIAFTTNSLIVGIADKTNSSAVIASFLGNNSGSVETLGAADNNLVYRRMTVGNLFVGSTGAYTLGDIITVDVDMAASTATFYRNGAARTPTDIALTSGKTYFPAMSSRFNSVGRLVTTGLTYLPSGATEWG